MGGSSWREKQDETMVRDESEAAFECKMLEIIVAVVSRCSVRIVLVPSRRGGSPSEMKR